MSTIAFHLQVSFRRSNSAKSMMNRIFFLHPSQTGHDGNRGRHSKFDVGSNGQRPSGVCYPASGGIPEAIENGVSGVLVPERDHEKLARRASRCSGEDPGYVSRTARSTGAKVWCEKKFRSYTRASATARGYLSSNDRKAQLVGALANSSGSILGSARGSRAGDRRFASRTFLSRAIYA